MSNTAPEPEAAAKKKSKLPLIVGLVLMLVLGGGGFYAVYSGVILGSTGSAIPNKVVVEALPDIAFVPMEPLVIPLGKGDGAKHLLFRAQLEVAKAHQSEVTMLLPRVSDVLNSYLRAVATKELEDRSALTRLRAQMLRRVQIVTGEGRVRDLLIIEFVLN
jgi:flagellar FliL protein